MFLFFIINKIATIIPTNSATGTENQTPIGPKNKGSIIMAATRNKNVLPKEIIADDLPSENAVNIDDA